MSKMQRNFNFWFLYDEKTGKLFWRRTKSSNAVKGSIVGCVDKSLNPPRIVLKLDGKKHHLARVIWCMHYGNIKKGEVIDHINGNPLDNRLSNLRAVSVSDNGRNRALSNNNKSGFNGVFFLQSSNKWRASIWTEGTFRHLGSFNTKEEAIAARIGGEKALGYISHKRVLTQETGTSHLDSSHQ